MNSIKKIFAALFSFLAALPIFAGQMTQTNGIDIWYETFGDRKDPALLLIMGGCCQGILWPTEFCQKLADEGFYVVRYDHRDTGLSTSLDFEKNPYNVQDMAKDAVGVLDAAKVDRAHLFGLSLGGPIAEAMAVYFPERVRTMTLVATSCEFHPMNLAFQGLPQEDSPFSKPSDQYLAWMYEFIRRPTPANQAEAVQQRVECWRMLNGSATPFEEARYTEIQSEFLARQKNPESMKNHVLACQISEDLVRTLPRRVKVPTLVLHGSEDPIFSPEHGEALAAAIEGSRYLFVPGMGHVPNNQFYDLYLNEIKKLAESETLKVE